MAEISSNDGSTLFLLKKVIEVERSLTLTLEKVEPWLTNSARTTNPRGANVHGFGKRVRSIPTTMEQVKQVLAVGRNYSSRTSAPAGWNPAAPVMGFSTPNPLPHQLRGGALAALQLERARQEERSQKRKRQEAEEEQAKAKKIEAEEKVKSSTNRAVVSDRPTGTAKKPDDTNTRKPSRPQPQVMQTTMNLSDSSSEEESDSD